MDLAFHLSVVAVTHISLGRCLSLHLGHPVEAAIHEYVQCYLLMRSVSRVTESSLEVTGQSKLYSTIIVRLALGVQRL